MIRAPLGFANTFEDPVENEPPASEQAAADTSPIAGRRFTFALDAKAKQVVFADGPVLKGKYFELFNRLAIQFQADLAADKRSEDFAFIPTTTLLQDLRILGHTLGQRVLRARKLLQRQFVAAIDYMLDKQDIIQSDRWKGYKLNPYLMLVEVSQLRR